MLIGVLFGTFSCRTSSLFIDNYNVSGVYRAEVSGFKGNNYVGHDWVLKSIFQQYLEREDVKKIPIIAMTANAFTEDIEKCLNAGMNTHIAKPIETEKMIQTIKDYIG